MKCQMCDTNFFSMEWAKDETCFKTTYIICDKCLLYILESRRDIAEYNLKTMGRNIDRLKDKVLNEKTTIIQNEKFSNDELLDRIRKGKYFHYSEVLK